MRQVIETAYGCIVAAFYAAAFFFGRFTARTQRILIAVLTILGIASCLVALRAEGDRTAEIRSLLYRHHYVVAHATAPANLLPLLVGAALFVAAAAGLFSRSTTQGARPLGFVFGLAALMTVLRFGVDRAAASETFAHAFGILWMAPAIGLNSTLLMSGVSRLGWLVEAAFVSRIPPIVATVIATHYDLGTHYSLVAIQRIEVPLLDGRFPCTPLDATQWILAIAIPQLLLWPALTVIVAAATARIARAFA